MSDVLALARLRPLLLAVLLSLAVFAAAACGGDEDDQQAATTAEAVVEPDEAAPPPEEQPPAEPAPTPEPAPTEVPPEAAPAPEQILRVNIGSEPLSLEPANAVEIVGGNIILNVMDPLVKLDEDLQPVSNLAESWETSADGLTITFNLRDDGRWTNGDPVTAADFEFAWKRALDPEVATSNAFLFYGIDGALEYNSCEQDCGPLAEAVGVKALDDATLEVTLTSPQPWFLQQAAHWSFVPVHQETVEEFGEAWTEPTNIVTNGPFELTSWEHEVSMTLERWDEWRDADSVQLERIDASMVGDPTTSLLAFEAGETDACFDGLCVPEAEIDRLKELPEFVNAPALATTFFGINTSTITDVNQRRAMAFALDNQLLIDEVLKTGETPATGWVPLGMPGFDVINHNFLPTSADIAQAQEFMSQVPDPKTKINLIYASENPAGNSYAITVQDAWNEIGLDTEIRAAEFQTLFPLLGPPPDSSIDVFLLGFAADFPDPISFLEIFTCDSGSNFTAFCDEAYDSLLETARQTPDNEARYEVYAELEALLTGEEGGLPLLPSAWGSSVAMARTNVENWPPNPLIQYDFSKVFLSAE